MIPCFDAHGRLVSVEKATFRPAAYGILIDEYHQVFLARVPGEPYWALPGGVLQPHETPKRTVQYHFRRATGMTPQVGSLLFVEERYQLAGNGEAWRLTAFYYALSRPLITAVSLGKVDESAVEGRWFPLADLSRKELQFGYEAIRAVQRLLDNPSG